jgi:hypothetical protein
VKDNNCVDKEYEKTDEQGVVVRRWGCIFCWSTRTFSHDRLKMPCYLTRAKQQEVRIIVEKGELKI